MTLTPGPHYFRQGCIFEPNQLLRDIDRIRHIPATIVQGRYGIICPVRRAFDLANAWPEADLKIVLAGHSVMDPGIVDVLVSVTDAMGIRTLKGFGGIVLLLPRKFVRAGV